MKFVIDEIGILAVQRSLLSLDASCWAVMPALITNSHIEYNALVLLSLLYMVIPKSNNRRLKCSRSCIWTLSEIHSVLHSLNIIKSFWKKHSEVTLISRVVFLKHTFKETHKGFKWNCYTSTANDCHQSLRTESRIQD